MWRHIIPLENHMLSEFELVFSFRIDPVFRSFLLDHNGGVPASGIFPTVTRERKLVRLLDFSDIMGEDTAWSINSRLRNKIGPKRIIVGTDSTGNFICLEREYKKQRIVTWSHISGDFEDCLLDIPAFLRRIN